MNYTAQEVLDRVRVSDIVSALGIHLPRRGNRTKCPIHRGDNPTFSFDEKKGVWYCFACGEGGGKVALVRRALGYEPKASLEWIAELAGVPLAKWTRDQMQVRSADLKSAEAEGRRLIEWREDIINYLRFKREIIQDLYHLAIRLGYVEHEPQLWAVIRDLDRKVEWHQNAPWEWLVEIQREAVTRSVSA